MNIIHDTFSQSFMRADIVSLQLLQTNNCNMIVIIISYILLRENDTEQM
jgi:hypothetical protein